MATITVTIPDTLPPGIAAGGRGSWGEAAEGLDDAQACERAATERLKELYRAHKKRTVSRPAAAAAALADAEADFQGVV